MARNHKLPTIFILDSDLPNPLNCSDKLRRIGAMFCKNCPSLNGGISACRHLGALILVLFAPYVVESTNLPVSIVNIKNKYNFLDPPEIMDQTISSVPMSMSKDRHSVNKRINNLIYDPERNVTTDSEEDNTVEPAEAGSVDEIIFPDCASASQESVPHSSGAENEEYPESQSSQITQSSTTSRFAHRMPEGENVEYAESQSSRISQSSTTSHFGQGLSNVERYINRICRRNPSRMIPPVSVHTTGKYMNTSSLSLLLLLSIVQI